MKKKRILFSLVLGIFITSNQFYSQSIDTLNSYATCETAIPVCGETQIYEIFNDSSSCISALKPQYLGYMLTSSSTINFNTMGHSGDYTLYGPMSQSGIASCEQIALGQVDAVVGNLNGLQSITISTPGFYILKVSPHNCLHNGEKYEVIIQTYPGRGGCCYPKEDCRPTTECKDCISSFSPTPGKYIFSAWTKGDIADINTSYSTPKVEVSFIGSSSIFSFSSSGDIIDGWQRIDGEVDVPVSATDIKITFSCASGDCYYDDVRFIPIDGKMVSYVYDPISLKMVAELDERNYATIYEYDEEGKLIRLKKETERGIMTIKENRENIHK